MDSVDRTQTLEILRHRKKRERRGWRSLFGSTASCHASNFASVIYHESHSKTCTFPIVFTIAVITPIENPRRERARRQASGDAATNFLHYFTCILLISVLLIQWLYYIVQDIRCSRPSISSYVFVSAFYLQYTNPLRTPLPLRRSPAVASLR